MIEKDYVMLRDMMCNIIGVGEDIFLKDQHYPMPYARAIVAEALYDMGYRWKSIANILHKRHSTLIIMTRKLHEIKDLKPYRQVKRIYDEFYKVEYVRD